MPFPFTIAREVALAAALIGLAACATQPGVPPASKAPVLAAATPLQVVATIRAAAGADDRELAVQPLRDPQVEDLRANAQAFEREGKYADSAAALDHALAIVPDDPALLQERAEAAVLLKDDAKAEALAKRAFELGSGVGPLCRRHWATVEQMRLRAGDAPGAADARTQVAGCKVAGVDRF